MRRLLPTRGIEPFRLTSTSTECGGEEEGGWREGGREEGAALRVARTSVYAAGYRRVDISLLEFRAPGGDVIHSLLSRAAPRRASHPRARARARLTNSLIIFADAADTPREKNVLRQTVNSRRVRYLRSSRAPADRLARCATLSRGDSKARARARVLLHGRRRGACFEEWRRRERSNVKRSTRYVEKTHSRLLFLFYEKKKKY